MLLKRMRHLRIFNLNPIAFILNKITTTLWVQFLLTVKSSFLVRIYQIADFLSYAFLLSLVHCDYVFSGTRSTSPYFFKIAGWRYGPHSEIIIASRTSLPPSPAFIPRQQ